MAKRENKILLADIREAIQRIGSYVEKLDYEGFLRDLKTQDAIARNIEIIGEAVKNITADFKKRHNAIEWKKLAGLRDKIIHYYFGVNLDIVWDVIKNKLPELKRNIEDILKEK